MRRFTTWSAMGVVLACSALFSPPATGGPAESDPAATEMLKLGMRGVYFVPNQGQWADNEVHYALRSRGLDVAFRESALTMHMTRENESTSRAGAFASRAEASMSRACEEAVLDIERDAPLADTRGSSGESAAYDHLTLTITFPGSNGVLPIGAQPQAAKFNYFVGGQGRSTASDVPSFGEVVYENLYDGVDLHVMGSDDGVLKYEFHVAPGADYAQIRIAYDGIESLCIDDAGDLQINTSFGTLADGAPVVWQEDLHPLPRLGGGGPGRGSSCDFIEAPANAAAHFSNHPHPDPPPQSRGREPESAPSRQHLPARFELCDSHTYRIALDGPVDPTREIIIDPDVEWMYYLGGSGGDGGFGVAVDSAGNALVMGYTSSTDFAGRNNASHGGARDTFVVKLRLADGPQLSVAATCPSGGPIQIEWSGATPGGQIALIFARNTDSFRIPNNRPCAGTQLGLGSSQIQLAWQGGGGTNGSRTLNSTTGPGACGGYLQLLDIATCGTSNVVRVE